MKFAIDSNFQGFTVAEFVRMQSKGAMIKLKGEVKASWLDRNLSNVESGTSMRFLTDFGINLKKKYDSKYKSWVDNVQKRLNKLEQDLVKKAKKFEKSCAKKPVSENEKRAFERDLNSEKDTETAKIQARAQKDYSDMLAGLLEGVRKTTLKAMGKAGKLFDKGKGSLTWNVLKFAVVAIMIVVAVATLPAGAGAVALGVGVAALVTKGLTSTTSFVKDCIEHKKRYDTAIVKVAKTVDGGVDAIDGAIADLRKAQAARDAMILNLAKAQRQLDDVAARSAPASKSGDMKKAADKLKRAKADMQSFEKRLGGEPLVVASELEAVRAAIKKARANIPVVTKSGAGSIGDILAKLDDAVSMADEVLGGL